MAGPVRVRRLADQEGRQLQRIVRRGSTNTVRYRRAMTLLASARGNRVPVTAQLVQADEDTVRDVIHRFNEIGPACLDPRRAGGRPRLLSPDDEDFVVQTAATRPARLGQPFTRWSIRPLRGHEPSRGPAHGADLPRVDRGEVGHTHGGARRPSAPTADSRPRRVVARPPPRGGSGQGIDVAQRGRLPR